MKYIRIGKIVNTHGIKGELRIISDFKYKDRVFKDMFNIYIGKDKVKETINTYRVHKNFDMITLYNYDNINQVLKYKGDYVFINDEDLNLKDNEYLDEWLIGFNVKYNNLSDVKVVSIEKYSEYKLLKVNYNDTFKLIPLNDAIIKDVNLEKKEITLDDNIKGLI